MSRPIFPYCSQRHLVMAWLHCQFAWPGFKDPDFHDTTLAGRTSLIDWLERRCRTMRAQGLAGAYHYDLPLHTELLRILAAEGAAQAAAEPSRIAA